MDEKGIPGLDTIRNGRERNPRLDAIRLQYADTRAERKEPERESDEEKVLDR